MEEEERGLLDYLKASGTWVGLNSLSMPEQLQRVKRVAKFKSASVFEVAIAEARSLCFSDPYLGEQTAYLALEVARQIPESPLAGPSKADFQGEAAMVVANCRRLRADWQGASQALRDAQSYLAEGTGNLLLQGMLLEFQSLLCSDTGDVEAALTYSSQALEIYEARCDREALARAAVLRANTLLAAGRAEEAIAAANVALSNVGPQDARIDLLARGIIIEGLIIHGRPREALYLFGSNKAVFDRAQERGAQLRVRYLVGRLLEGLDFLGEAEKIYANLIDVYLESELYKEAFITLLTLFELHFRHRALDKAASVCEAAITVWSQGSFNRESRQAWEGLLAAVRSRQLSEHEVARARQAIVNYSGLPPAEGIPQALQHALRPPVAESALPKSGPAPPPIPAALVRETYEAALEAFERDLLAAAVEQAGGNISEASRRLKMTRNTLKAKMKRFGLGGHGQILFNDQEDGAASDTRSDE
jgi:tetratricopeptide (TPR) repeat protein